MSETMPSTVAIIGSFKQNYAEVLKSWRIFTDAGIDVTSPKGAPVIEPGIDFVRFESDDPKFSDEQVEQVALHRILRADFVFTEAPNGYVGRTTCYEIGKITDRNIPLYFSDQPVDLPIKVPEMHIASASELVARFRNEMPKSLLESLTGVSLELEENLVKGNYLEI